mmetsp:Transcript_21167/g.59185  ORF Transcript_21167/g.59185 Transcript_21167/m.59185 type:complete len:207 (-) Transcript_21167:52-672(-)
MEGGHVEHYIRSRRLDVHAPWVPPTHRIFNWSLCVARALVYLHEKGIAHGNLRPSNLLLDGPAEALRVATTPILSPPEHRAALDSRSLEGCLYSAPEVMCQKPYTEKADIYAFAFIVWFLCTGIRPLAHLDNDGEHLPEEHVLKAFSEGKAPRPSLAKVALRKDMKGLIQQAWHANASERPDAKEVLRRLEEAEAAGRAPQCCSLQ